MHYSLLPTSLKALVNIIGLELCLRIVSRYGGDSLYIPRNKLNSEILDLCGVEAATKLQDYYGGTHLRIATAKSYFAAKRNMQICQQKKSSLELAKQNQLTQRTIFRVRADPRPDEQD